MDMSNILTKLFLFVLRIFSMLGFATEEIDALIQELTGKLWPSEDETEGE